MQISTIVRIAIMFFLLFLAQAQLMYQSSTNPSTIRDPTPPDVQYFDDNLSNYPEVKPQFRLEVPLPVTPGDATESEINSAVKLFRLPTWSAGYTSCKDPESEISCFELNRAAKTLEGWIQSVQKQKTNGQVFVNASAKTLPDRLSMLYHGLQIAVTTNRNLVTNHKWFSPIDLPDTVKNSESDEGGDLLPTDHQFGCANVSPKFPNLQFKGASWPQVLYTHATIAPFMRDHFGFHAAYYLGNYLFGSTEKPSDDCFLSDGGEAIEGWRFWGDQDIMRPNSYPQYQGRCGFVPGPNLHMISNDKESKITQYDITYMENNTKGMICGLRKLTSSKRILQTFGSRLGFWATALQGRKGSFMNGIDRICVNMTNSQQGSLWHTFCPVQKAGYIYRTNSYLYICGPDIKDTKSYLDYLLW